MDLRSDTMSAIFSQDATALRLYIITDGRRNIVQMITDDGLLHTFEEALLADSDHPLRILGNLTHRPGSGRICIIAMIAGAGVDGDDITILQNHMTIRDTMDDFFVDRDATGSREVI